MTHTYAPSPSRASPIRSGPGSQPTSGLEAAGRPLPAALRQEVMGRFGSAAARARIHDGAAGAQVADAHDAEALAVGQDVYFGEGRFAPDSAEGWRLLAHELAHVAQQQRGGPTPPFETQAHHEVTAEKAATAAASGDGPISVLGATAVAPAARRKRKPSGNPHHEEREANREAGEGDHPVDRRRRGDRDRRDAGVGQHRQPTPAESLSENTRKKTGRLVGADAGGASVSHKDRKRKAALNATRLEEAHAKDQLDRQMGEARAESTVRNTEIQSDADQAEQAKRDAKALGRAKQAEAAKANRNAGVVGEAGLGTNRARATDNRQVVFADGERKPQGWQPPRGTRNSHMRADEVRPPPKPGDREQVVNIKQTDLGLQTEKQAKNSANKVRQQVGRNKEHAGDRDVVIEYPKPTPNEYDSQTLENVKRETLDRAFDVRGKGKRGADKVKIGEEVFTKDEYLKKRQAEVAAEQARKKAEAKAKKDAAKKDKAPKEKKAPKKAAATPETAGQEPKTTKKTKGKAPAAKATPDAAPQDKAPATKGKKTQAKPPIAPPPSEADKPATKDSAPEPAKPKKGGGKGGGPSGAPPAASPIQAAPPHGAEAAGGTKGPTRKGTPTGAGAGLNVATSGHDAAPDAPVGKPKGPITGHAPAPSLHTQGAATDTAVKADATGPDARTRGSAREKGRAGATAAPSTSSLTAPGPVLNDPKAAVHPITPADPAAKALGVQAETRPPPPAEGRKRSTTKPAAPSPVKAPGEPAPETAAPKPATETAPVEHKAPAAPDTAKVEAPKTEAPKVEAPKTESHAPAKPSAPTNTQAPSKPTARPSEPSTAEKASGLVGHLLPGGPEKSGGPHPDGGDHPAGPAKGTEHPTTGDIGKPPASPVEAPHQSGADPKPTQPHSDGAPHPQGAPHPGGQPHPNAPHDSSKAPKTPHNKGGEGGGGKFNQGAGKAAAALNWVGDLGHSYQDFKKEYNHSGSFIDAAAKGGETLLKARNPVLGLYDEWKLKTSAPKDAQGNPTGGQEMDPVEAAISTGMGFVGMNVMGKYDKGLGELINAANNAAGGLGAPETVQLTTEGLSAVTPSGFGRQLFGEGYRGIYNTVKFAATGDGKGLDKQAEQMVEGKGGPALQGYAMIAQIVADAPFDGWEKAMEKAARAGKGSWADKVGSALGDETYKFVNEDLPEAAEFAKKDLQRLKTSIEDSSIGKAVLDAPRKVEEVQANIKEKVAALKAEAESVKTGFVETKDAAFEQAAALKSEAKETFHEVKDRVTQNVETVREEVNDKLDRAAEAATETYGTVETYAGEAYGTASDYASEKVDALENKASALKDSASDKLSEGKALLKSLWN